MASKPSLYDQLMSGASKKKRPPQQKQGSSPKKAKTDGSKPLGSQIPVRITSKDPSSPGIKEAHTEMAPKIEKSPQKKARVEIETKNEGTRVDLTAKIAVSVAELKKKSPNFNPEKAAYWGKDENVPFPFVSKALQTRTCLKPHPRTMIVITEIACNVLRTVIETTPKDLLSVVYLLAHKIAPAHEGMELGIRDGSLLRHMELQRPT